jgi:hypothetical protein
MIIVLLAADSTLLLHYGAVQTSAAALASFVPSVQLHRVRLPLQTAVEMEMPAKVLANSTPAQSRSAVVPVAQEAEHPIRNRICAQRSKTFPNFA